MPLYRVVFSIEINEESPQAAAETVYAWLTDRASMKPCFSVYTLDGSNRHIAVDLEEGDPEDEPEQEKPRVEPA